MKPRKAFTWLCQILAALVFGSAATAKFVSAPATVTLFSKLGMEPSGRYIVAVLEAVAALLLLTEDFAAIGATISTSVVVGAGIAHFTKVGFSSLPEGLLWIAGAVLSHVVLYLKRKTIPVLGETL